jgi:hypothetical protein
MFGPPRHAAYYPFCDYSPELVALRVGAEVGASLRFIDLDYPDQIRAEREAVKETGAPRVESLLAERHFKRSRYLKSLARRAGCRDHNDLWDHLFETRINSASRSDKLSVERFIQDVAAGMPSPYYYDQLWQALSQDCSAEPFASIAARILVELGQLTRQKKLAVALSAADEIAALEQSRRLAAMRGHPGPTREDLLDGIRSCFVKGSMDAEGEIVLGLAGHALGGTSIGEVAPEAGVPPLVEDFRVIAQKLRLNIRDSIRRKSSLDLYRKTSHRQSSRFFHSLTFLEVPFASLDAGPDFVKGVGLERLFEHWSYQWTPQTESQLVEASIFGASVEEAAANRLVEAIGELENTGRGRCAAEAVGMLVNACRMGLHRHTERLLMLIAAQVNEDPSLASLTNALNQLVLLWESREPLEAHRLTEIPVLIRAAYERACYPLHNRSDTPAEAANETLQSLIAIRDLLRSRASGNQALDASLFYEPLTKVFLQARCPALLVGGVTGLLHGDGRLPESELFKLLAGSLSAASAQAEDQTAFLIGLLRACRELAWRNPALAEVVEKLLAAWSEEEFIQRLPHLRMAFADLTPREADQVAAIVARLHCGEKIGTLHYPEVSEAEMLVAVRVNALVMKALLEDGLGLWIETPVSAGQTQEVRA